jgi:ferredoxin-type protein NapH
VLKKRRIFQIVSLIVINPYIPAFFKRGIYQGNVKGVCVPVLNCYSCPSAIGACPIGAIQNFFASLKFNLSIAEYQFGLYVWGILGAVGSAIGRIPCGWLCPFGLFQEIVYKIPSPKISIPKFMTYFRYAFLVIMVIFMPLLILDEFGLGQTWFCKLVCPAGTLEAGIPLVLLNETIRNQIGFLFTWKMIVLVLFLVWMVFSQRPFCRTACPLGAIFGLFNKVSLFRMISHDDKCVQCNSCFENCPVGIKFYESPNSPDCIRCLKCTESCKYGAIEYEFFPKKREPVKTPASSH